MIITQANAALVAAIFTTLSDNRFTMRGVTAIKKNAPEGTTVEQVLDTAAQMGIRQRTRIADGKLLLQRPGTPEEALVLAEQAKLVLSGERTEVLDIDFTPVQETAPDVMGDIERGLGRAADVTEDDELIG